jgi:hypothetical protein
VTVLEADNALKSSFIQSPWHSVLVQLEGTFRPLTSLHAHVSTSRSAETLCLFFKAASSLLGTTPYRMASGSGAAPTRVGEYDVFINHCGADCKRDFAVMLKEELKRVRVRGFFDEHSLEVGDHAAKEMLKALEEATYGIVIFSPRFFEREWCMKELEMFVRRGRVVPIYFGSFEAVVEARWAAIKGRAWTTFKQFVQTKDEYCEVAQASTVHTGVRLAKDGWWSFCIQKVRDDVLRLLGKEKGGHRILEDELLVGQQKHLVELKRLLGVPQKGPSAPPEPATSQEVGIVGVRGMGGVGKSTMVKKLHDEPDVREWFSGGVCWLEVGKEPSDDRIQDLQAQILKRLGNIDEDPGNPTRGRELIRQRLGAKKVLICLDNVWKNASFATPIVQTGDLGAGSRILKTSRSEDAVGGMIYDPDTLAKHDA